MSLVYRKDKQSGTTYVYESKGYWDKEKQQARARRTLIGKIDVETGEIVPTRGSCRKNSPYLAEAEKREILLEKANKMSISELRQTVVSLELALIDARFKLRQYGFIENQDKKL